MSFPRRISVYFFGISNLIIQMVFVVLTTLMLQYTGHKAGLNYGPKGSSYTNLNMQTHFEQVVVMGISW